ncbi:inositol 1,4,5-trisphosphate receptor-interacting protein [Spinachia spinachia]
MQGAVARVCVVVAAAILNHPLLLTQDNGKPPDQDEELMARMQEHEERLRREQARLDRELSQLDSEQGEADPGEGYSWYFWSAVSFAVFFAVEVCRAPAGTDADPHPVEDEDERGSHVTPRTVALDKDVLSDFCDKCAYASARNHWRVRDFVGGFAGELADSLRNVCDGRADMEVGDFVGIGSVFESWEVGEPLTCDLIAPFLPPGPYSFQFHLWCGPRRDAAPHTPPGCGGIKMSRLGEEEEGCICGSPDMGEDVLCMLHREDDPLKKELPLELCCVDTRSLAKERVVKWFQLSVTRAWRRISHKYDFEVTFRHLDAAGALKIRFRSGKAVLVNIIPAVRFEDTDAYFVSHFPADCGTGSPDPCWPVSLAVYEGSLLEHFSKLLPPNSCHLHCLQTVTFLHRKQAALTGPSGLTNYHLKTALLHLLLTKRPSEWGADATERRLRDLLGFVHASLREKRLHHALVGNRNVPEEVRVPEAIRAAQPVNLLQGLVLQRKRYAATVGHFDEMLRNAPALMREYARTQRQHPTAD